MEFVLNKPITTEEPDVEVDPGLPVGSHRFRLVVINERGQRSQPAEVVVTVSRLAPIPGPVRPGPLTPIPT